MNWGFHDNRFPELCSGKSFIFAKAYFSDCIVSSVLIEACRRTLWPARKNVKIHTRLNCRSPSLIPSHDSSHLKFRNYTPAKKVGRNWKHGKRSILIKVRSEVKFQDNMQRDALFRGVLFCRSNGEERFVPWEHFSHLRWIGVLPTRSCSVRRVLRRTSRNQGCPCFTVPLRG